MRKKRGEKDRKADRQAGRQTSECHEEGEMEKVFDGRSRRREEEGEGGREGEAAQFMPLSPCSEDSSLGGLRL